MIAQARQLSQSRKLSLLLATCVAATVAAVAPAHAAEWRVTPAMNSSVGYVDNPRLLIGGGESYETYQAELSVPMSYNDGRTAITLKPRFAYAAYPDNSLLDRNETYVTLAAQRSFETAVLAGSIDYVHDTTLTSELGLTGLQEVNRPHESLALTLSPTLLLSDRMQVGAQLYRVENTYSDAAFTGLVDYDYSLGALSTSYAFSEKVSFSLQGSFGRLDVPDSSIRSDNTNITAALDWHHSPAWSSHFSAGPTRTQSESGDATGYVYSAGLSRQGERTVINAQLARDVTPTGRGVLVTRDQASLSTQYSFTERLVGSLAARFVRTEDAVVVSNLGTERVDYASLDASLQWLMNESWSIVLSLGGRTQSYQELDDANGFNAAIGIAWHGDPHAWAR